MKIFGIVLVTIGELACLLVFWLMLIGGRNTLNDIAGAIAAVGIAGTGAIILHGLK